MNNFIDYNSVIKYCVSHAFNIKGIHGIQHWLSVRDYGLYIAKSNGADVNIIELFAWFHDIGRVADRDDFGHGNKSVELMDNVHGKLFNLQPIEYDKLRFAVKHHTETIHDEDISIGTCWDSDRLDLNRLGRFIDVNLLNTVEGKQLAMQINDRNK